MLTALKTIISSVLSKYGSFAFYGVLGVFLFGAGAYSSSVYYRAQIADKDARTTLLIVEAQNEANKRINNAITEKESALRVMDSYRSRISELSKRMLVAESRGSTISKSSGHNDGESLTRCRRLLSEGGNLLEESCRLYGRCAADHDALAELLK